VILCAAAVIGWAGCGGGTTGTSPGGDFKFSGVAEDADGERVGQLTMTVRSAGSDQALVDSGTNTDGEFAMELPGSEERFVVEVDGVGSTLISRKQRGNGAMSAKLAVTEDGAISARELSEAQVDNSTLCSSLEVSGTTIQIVRLLGVEQCIFDIVIASQELALGSFTGAVSGVCRGAQNRATIQEVSAGDNGRVRIDLRQVLDQASLAGCEDLEVLVRSSRVPELATVFRIQ
jgi:hypothetical protein